MYWIYVLESPEDGGWYIGYTKDLKRRLQEHKGGNGCRTTSLKETWTLIYCEGYTCQRDALGREQFLKSGSGRRFLKRQLRHYLEGR
jgi:putative endonuclease